MAPKRKNNKASKPFHSSPGKAAPGLGDRAAELVSSKRRNSVQGGKTSRLAPSIALHMTTRRAAKTASVQTSSGAPSIASSASRRSSLNDLAQFQDAHSDVDDEHERPTKRTRLSTDSGSPQPSAPSMVDQPPAVNAVDASQTPELHHPESHPPVNGAATSGKRRRASDGSSQSVKPPSAHPNGVLTRTQSDVSEMQPRRKKRKTTQTPAADSADLPPEPELTDASTAPNSPEHIADVDSSQNLHHVLPTNGDAPTKLGKRMPGRRRAPHSDVNVETDLRRQLNLKMSYRSLAKVQKLILEELSNRAVRNLENDRDYYKRVPEYEPLMAALDQRKQGRLAQLNALRKEKLDQLERVRIATEHIEREKYIQRFKDLQEDLLLQCYYRMKQIDREAKGREAAATDDEDNLVAATFKFPTTTGDERLESKYASRSRAYVDTEEMLEEDMHRRRLDRLREEFVARDEDADDEIERLPFAAYNGQDRKEAVSHWNIMSLIAAANDVENAPPPPPPPPPVIPNEQADALFLLASVSADASKGVPPQIKEQPRDEPISAPLVRQPSPMEAVQSTEEQPFPENTTKPKPVEQPIVQEPSQRNSPRPEAITLQTNIDLPAPKSEAPARSTHRIMDILNEESESPVKSHPAVSEQLPVLAPLKNGPDNHVQRYDPLQTYPEPPKIVPRLPEHGSWSSTTRATPSWNSRYKNMSEETLRKRDPMKSIRAMLDAKALSEGRIPPGSRPDKLENSHKAPMERDRSRDSAPLARPFSSTDPSEHSDHSNQDITKAPGPSYTASPPAPPLSYNQSPRGAPSYLPPRSVSQETSSQWPGDRRMSGSQAPRPSASPYAGSPPQPYHPEPSKAVPPHPLPHSHYSPTTTTQLPSISAALPPKPSGPPPSNPINFRFAHYDPAPQRPSYPSPSPANYAPAPRPPHQVAPPPYTAAYNPPTSYHTGYVAPPGSFQAPPPPPPTALSPYPPLKIHQYGGQPILPANMAPPPHHTQPAPLAFATQQQPQPSTYASSAHQPQQPRSIHRRTSSYEQAQAQAPNSAAPAAPREAAGPPPPPPALPETASRQRRQYRSYHTPGTQFRNYSGPAESARRRGG